MKYVVLINPLAGKGDGARVEEALKGLSADVTFVTMTEIDLKSYVGGLGPEVCIVIAGGDGTLNRFVNAVDCDKLENPVFLFPAGNGNDFYNDVTANYKEHFGGEPEQGAVLRIDKFLKNLPVVTVNGKTSKFINGVGYGIDGYCCEEGDRLKAAGKKVNYTSIAIKGLLFRFKPRAATVSVDGKEYTFKKVWIAPAMNGRYYGGGMIPTPAQNRLGDRLSLCVMFGAGKLKTLMVFPSIFKGKHVGKKTVRVLEGREITVRFAKPCALQIDGETVLNVSEYTARRFAEKA